jgi:hypothetical protein
MTARTLAPRVADRLAKLCGLFGSDHDGERAPRLADQLIHGHGLTWGDVITVPAAMPMQSHSLDWRMAVRFCIAHQHALSPREFSFIVTLTRWHGEPTLKQHKWLNDIVARLRGYS